MSTIPCYFCNTRLSLFWPYAACLDDLEQLEDELRRLKHEKFNYENEEKSDEKVWVKETNHSQTKEKAMGSIH